MQSQLILENQQLKLKLENEHDNSNVMSLSLLCNEAYKLKCDISQLLRVLQAIRDGENFCLSLLLRNKGAYPLEQKGLEAPIEECFKDIEEARGMFGELEKNTLDWYSEYCGNNCRIS